MLKGWLRGHAPITTSKSLNSIDELAQIQDAMSSVTYIMDDDLEAAEEHLNKGNSPFHQLGVGVCTFMRATLGFEQEVMREASNALYQAECSAYENQKRAARDANAYRSPIYPPGTEYAVCQAEAQLMSSVVGLLNENITEAIKSFYKLRKAYLALEQIMESERNYLAKKGTTSVNSAAGSKTSTRPSSIKSKTGSLLKGSRPSSSRGLSSESRQEGVGQTSALPTGTPVKKEKNEDDDDFEFVDAAENKSGSATPGEYMGHLNITTADGNAIAIDNLEKKVDLQASSATGLPSSINNPSDSVPTAITDFEKLKLQETAGGTPVPDLSEYSDHPVDAFILAGSNFCFGMLLLMLSFIPPSFAMLLKVIGFKGDRERGMKMLWQATNFNDIHGAMAGIVLLGYMNGYTSLCDMIPSSGDGAYPKERCKTLLRGMRKRYPKSHLWLLEESRMLAVDGELEQAVDFVSKAGASPLKQLEALSWFERSLNNMYMHDYEATAHAFKKCIELNNWSHGLYYFICGATFVELYRRTKDTDPKVAAVHAEKAKENFTQVIPNTGKKRFMGRQLPFDVFVSRKIQKWEARAKEWKCDFIDAIGVSPLEEMIFFWNGYKRMRSDHLALSLENLAWSESTANSHWEKEGLDEKSILIVLRAATLRNLGRTGEAKALLEKEILPVERGLFKGHLRDSWTAPCARYEMAANIWREADAGGNPGQDMERLGRCRDWLAEVSAWDGFDLDARIGMKVTTGKGTLRKFGIQC